MRVVSRSGMHLHGERVRLVDRGSAAEEFPLWLKRDPVEDTPEPREFHGQLDIGRVHGLAIPPGVDAKFRWNARLEHGDFQAEVTVLQKTAAEGSFRGFRVLADGRRAGLRAARREAEQNDGKDCASRREKFSMHGNLGGLCPEMTLC
jgi:hypothetical protein